ncbi:hypothetical protein DDZ18_13475 [Marinicauda salina]|uniref:DUF1579 domain-containing protein n=1 Tax=Marinicauda salina TaxID=2135793 RepID=A0A2U2BQY7_9PROT|nr:hypothetical protein DDZ18_13475 [Marinicauda salina]
MPEEMVSFFTGAWSGAGAFADGRPIEADLEIESVLDGRFLRYRHSTRDPLTWDGLWIWGVDPASGDFIANVFDNRGLAREFESAGWRDDRLVLVTTYHSASADARTFERFTYEKTSQDSFRMTFERSRDGIEWRLGDYLDFERRED